VTTVDTQTTEKLTNGILTIVVTLMAAFMLAALAFFFIPRIIMSNEHRELANGAVIGSTKGQVVARLGNPKYQVKSLKEVPDIASWQPPPSKPVENEVYIYQRTFWRIYIYIDINGRVQYTELART